MYGPPIGLPPLFSDPDGDNLEYSVVSYDRSVLSMAEVSSFLNTLSTRAVNGAEPQQTTVRVRATDPGGLSADNQVTLTIAPCPEPGHTVEGGSQGTDDGDDDDVGIVDSPYDRGPYPP